jgi:hypothetical protein
VKGPFQRLKHDLRRLWECPVCNHRAHTPGDVTSCLCRCQQQVDPATRRFMRLIEGDTLRAIRIAEPQIVAPDSVESESLPAPTNSDVSRMALGTGEPRKQQNESTGG